MLWSLAYFARIWCAGVGGETVELFYNCPSISEGQLYIKSVTIFFLVFS